MGDALLQGKDSNLHSPRSERGVLPRLDGTLEWMLLLRFLLWFFRFEHLRQHFRQLGIKRQDNVFSRRRLLFLRSFTIEPVNDHASFYLQRRQRGSNSHGDSRPHRRVQTG